MHARLITRCICCLAAFFSLQGYANVSQEVLKSLQSADETRVIVQLKIPAAARQEMQDTRGAGRTVNLNSYIKETQQKLASEMGWRNLNKVVNFELLPAVAKIINRRELQQLQQSDLVENVTADRLNKLSRVNSHRQIGTPVIRNNSNGGKGTAVAVIDSGIESGHPYLADKVLDGACYSGLGSCRSDALYRGGLAAAEPCDFAGCDHGTHVAGIIAGSNTKMDGVAPEAKLLSVNVMSRQGEKVGILDSDILQAMEWVYYRVEKYNVVAINMSLGGGLYVDTCDSSPFKIVMDLLLAKGVVTTVASGNEAQSHGVSSPGCVSTAVTVGATNLDGSIARYSNSYHHLDMVAPGSNIYSSVTGAQFAEKSGTSMATPHVAGAVALLRSSYPNADASTVIKALYSGRSFTDPRNDVRSPFLDLPAAMNWLSEHAMPVPSKPVSQGAGAERNKPKQPINRSPEKGQKDDCIENVDGIKIRKTTGKCAKNR